MADDRDEQSATEEEKLPINNSSTAETGMVAPPDGDASVKVRRPQRQGCYMTRGQACCLALAILFIVIIVGGVVGILTRTHFCQDATEPDYSQWSSRMEASKPSVRPGYPWSGIRLPDDLKPSAYKLELRVDLDKFVFNGSVEITVRCLKKTEYIILHVNSLNVDQSLVAVEEMDTGRRVGIYRHVRVPINQFYVLQTSKKLKPNSVYKISFGGFDGKLLDDLRGLYRSSYTDHDGNTRYLAASQLQSVDARKVFPCFDEPDLKANFTVSIEHMPEYVALSNMPKRNTIALSNGWKKDEFETTPVMSTYLLAFVVADFLSVEKQTRQRLRIRIWSQPGTIDQTSYAIGFAEKVYDFFGTYFNTPEIVPKADHAAIPDFSAGAMENWGLVLYRETALLHDEDVSSISNKYWVSLVMAHEIAHTWFGNMVTMRWWDDLWLNEGFANTLMYFALESIYPNWKVFDLQLVNNVYSVMTKDSLLTSHAISTPIQDPDDIPQYFDSISYDKGMAVLRLLRGFLGWDDFRNGLKRYIEKYKFKNAEMRELWKTFAEAVNHKYRVGEIMETWTRQMGFPVVDVKYVQTRKGVDTYSLRQTRFLLNPEDEKEPSSSPYGYTWYIPFDFMVEGQTKANTTWMNRTSASIDVPAGKWIIGNVDYMGFYRTNYDEPMWLRLIEQLKRDHKVFSAANRAGLISDAFNLARANKLSYGIAFNLTTYLTKEEDYVPWRAFLDAMDFIKGMVANSNYYGRLQDYIQNFVAPQYRRVGTSDQGDLLDRNLRRAMLEEATAVGVPDAIDWAKRSFGAWKDYGTRLPPDYAVVIFAVGVQQGGEKAWNHLWEKSRTTRVASEAEIMMNALAYAQEPWLLWRYARWSLDSTKIRMQDVRNLFRYFAATPLGRSVALQFLLTNWKEINTRFGMDAFLLRDIIYATTTAINTEYERLQLMRLFWHTPPAGVARKAAENSLALIKSNIKWMKTNQDTIIKWLEQNGGSEHDRTRT